MESGRNGYNRVELLLTVEEGNQLISCPLGAEGKSNCREPVDRVESEQDIVVLAEKRVPKSASLRERKAWTGARKGRQRPGQRYLELIDEHGDGIELVAGVYCFSHGVSRGRSRDERRGKRRKAR